MVDSEWIDKALPGANISRKKQTTESFWSLQQEDDPADTLTSNIWPPSL